MGDSRRSPRSRRNGPGPQDDDGFDLPSFLPVGRRSRVRHWGWFAAAGGAVLTASGAVSDHVWIAEPGMFLLVAAGAKFFVDVEENRPPLNAVVAVRSRRRHPRALSVTPKLWSGPDAGDPWFAGWLAGGGLRWDGAGHLTASDGRGRVETWPTVPPEARFGRRAVSRARRRAAKAVRRRRGPAPDRSTEVAEIAAVCGHMDAHWLFLLTPSGSQLARLPIAGFDEPRVIALARAAGIVYRRYMVAKLVDLPRMAGGHCFPQAAHFTRIEGPTDFVSLGSWVSGVRRTK
jgi:hypothetical protein